ncbi:MAG: glucose-6-phosphate isomerase [Oscillospiraceae bacterium]
MGITIKTFFENNENITNKYDISSAHQKLHEMNCAKEMVGWLNFKVSDDEITKIKLLAEKIKSQSDILIVVGAGGSYCGAKAIIEALNSQFYNDFNSNSPKIYFVGNNLSGSYMDNILKLCENKNVSLNVISKSGTTLEPSATFRIFKNYIENRYGKDEACERIICTTDEKNGVLRQLANKYGYQTLVVPSNIGGRFSVLTAVGLLPIAVSGINIEQLLEGAYDAEVEFANTDFSANNCYQYALARKFLADMGKTVEMTAAFEPSTELFLEWHRQLFGESLGKNRIGVLPTVAIYTRDLHSIGQYIQDGSPILFETIFKFGLDDSDCVIPDIDGNADGLNYLTNQKLSVINDKAVQGVIDAHCGGNVPVILIDVPKLDTYNLGNLIYFLEKSCAINGILDNINPFDQPGVEAYKKNIKRVLIDAKL